jgi:phosphatidylglycerophosphate synthase
MTRTQTSILSGPEKTVLLWLAQRTPQSINSDHLTALGLIAMLGVGLGYWLSASRPVLGLCVATACLALNWLGDSLDGTLARFRNKQRPRYGFYVDHVVDMLGALFVLGGLALSGWMSPVVAAALLILFFMLSINCYLVTCTLGEFRLSYGPFSPTELRVLLAIGNVFLYRKPHAVVFGNEMLLFDAGGVIGAACMALLLIGSIAHNTARLYREEPIS